MKKKAVWTFPLRKKPADFSARLMVFPYAAGGSTSLRPLVEPLPESVEVIGVALPGRERRFGESPATTIPEIVEGVTEELAAWEQLPTYLFGHSMGAGLALAMAQSAPGSCAGLIISGRLPDGIMGGSLHKMTDGEILAFLRSLGNTAAELLADTYWRNHLIQLFRHDTELDARATGITVADALSAQLVAIGGAEDPYVDARQLTAWATRTSKSCEVRIFPGGHFYLLDPAVIPDVADVISRFVFSTEDSWTS